MIVISAKSWIFLQSNFLFQNLHLNDAFDSIGFGRFFSTNLFYAVFNFYIHQNNLFQLVWSLRLGLPFCKISFEIDVLQKRKNISICSKFFIYTFKCFDEYIDSLILKGFYQVFKSTLEIFFGTCISKILLNKLLLKSKMNLAFILST